MDVILLTCVSGIFFQRSMGAYQLAHFLRENGYTVQVIDFTDHFTEDELIATVDKFVTKNTLVLGLSTTFYSNHLNTKYIRGTRDRFEILEIPENIVNTITTVKTKHNNIKILVGGSKSLSAENLPMVDKAIHGYAEDEVLDYLNKLPNNHKKKKSNIIPIRSNDQPIKVEKIFDIETLNHRFIDQDCVLPGETLPLEVSRGCIFKCSFCAFPLNGKSKFDYLRDPAKIKDELIYNYEKFGTTNYFLSDDTFNDSTYKIENLHKVITSLPFKIKFTTYLRLDLLHAHQEQIIMLKEMGLASPFFGIESLNQKSVSSIGKGMKVEKIKDFLLELHHNHWGPEIPITCSFIIGLPHETRKTLNETYEWVVNAPINSLFFPLTLTNKSFYKSEFHDNYEKYGYRFDEKSGYWENDEFNFDIAHELSEQFNSKLMYSDDLPSSWFLMTLLNHGYSFDEAIKTQIKDLNYSRIMKHMKRNIQAYKNKLDFINTNFEDQK